MPNCGGLFAGGAAGNLTAPLALPSPPLPSFFRAPRTSPFSLRGAAQALSLRADQGPPGRGTAAAMDQIRKRVAVLEHDRSLAADVERLRLAIRSGEILSAARAASAPGQAGLS